VVGAIVLIGAIWVLASQPAAQPTAQADDWKREGVLYLDHSLNAQMHPVPVSAVRLGDGFWAARRRITLDRSLPTMLDLLEEHGDVDNFRRLSGKKNVPRRGPLYTDSDVYKWIEAAAWAIASSDTPSTDRQHLKAKVDSLIVDIVGAQEPSGYLNTYYVGDRAHLRFTELVRSHEDYCLGHLIQAGIAYYRATGERTLLDPAIKFADYIVANFGPTQRPFFTGHPELEMALVELYRTTGQTKYLDFVHYLFSGVDRDRLHLTPADTHYAFSGRAFISRTEFEGHAVRALYATAGATDYFAESGDVLFKKTLDLLWTDLTMRKMYITGGIGSRSAGEAFGDPYELPNSQAYAETCASVANVMWNFRMLAITANSRYADVMERALYNGVNSGMSLSGTLYCYRNPLQTNGDKARSPWYDTTCCPPNVERLFESLPGYFYATSREGVFVNLFHNSDLEWHLENGTSLKLIQSTNYPWSGDIRLAVMPERPSQFTIFVRWPGWATAAEVQINGTKVEGDFHPGQYIPLTRTWAANDSITVSFPIQTTPMQANPRVADLYGHLALMRGPLVYALEQIDQNGASLSDIFIRAGSTGTAEVRKDLLGGVSVIHYPGLAAEKPLSEEGLYESATVGFARQKRPITLTFIPYYAWANRDQTPMEVWVPAVRSLDGNNPSPNLHAQDRRLEAR
jgi:uncharacterized protein